MDKKYQQPYNSKNPVSDSKKNQDINAKQFPKSSKKREPTKTNNFSKNDLPRKSNPQKTKIFDKRPKPKGQYHGCATEESKVMENEVAEVGSVMVKGSKKQNNKNGNYLLNFNFTPRNVQGGWSSYNSHHYNRWHSTSQRHKYDKDQFLQANCQFVVAANIDYSQYSVNYENNVDKLIKWELIEQIRVESSEDLSCPICLYPPVAGKMTRCGHVYCWPCILNYLSLSEEPGPKCPVCYFSVFKSGLKSVKIIITENNLNVGDNVTFRLMRREKNSLIAMPVIDVETPAPIEFLSLNDFSCKQAHSKLLLAQTKDIEGIINLEKEELINELSIQQNMYPDSLTIPFIELALKELEERKKLLAVAHSESTTIQNKIKKSIDEKNNFDNQEMACGITKSECESEESYSSDDLFNENVTNFVSEVTSGSQKFYYFYQAENGQNIYLLAMNIKMLEKQYGSLEKSPLTISGTVLEREVNSLTEEIRNKMRYLSHLPVTSQYELVEIDLRSQVSDDVFKCFQDQINNRQFKRKKLERRERKREKKIAEEENKLMGKYPSPNVCIDSHKHFPQFQSEPESEEFNISTSTSSVASSPSTNFDEFLASGGGENNRSFAQMLLSNTKPVAWPSLQSVKTVETTIAQSNPMDPDAEEYKPPSYNPNLGDAVARAFENLDLTKQERSVTGSKKKKKT